MQTARSDGCTATGSIATDETRRGLLSPCSSALPSHALFIHCSWARIHNFLIVSKAFFFLFLRENSLYEVDDSH